MKVLWEQDLAPGDVIFVQWGAGRMSAKKTVAIVDDVKNGRVSIRKWRASSRRLTKHAFYLDREVFLGGAPDTANTRRAKDTWLAERVESTTTSSQREHGSPETAETTKAK